MKRTPTLAQLPAEALQIRTAMYINDQNWSAAEAELESAEVVQLQGLMGESYDRPAALISNLLCFGYGICRPPLTGGEATAPQARLVPVAMREKSPSASLALQPNPASSWVVFKYDLQTVSDHAELVVRDATGRVVFQPALAAPRQQVLWDTREVGPGAYTVELMNGGRSLRTEKLILQP